MYQTRSGTSSTSPSSERTTKPGKGTKTKTKQNSESLSNKKVIFYQCYSNPKRKERKMINTFFFYLRGLDLGSPDSEAPDLTMSQVLNQSL